VNTYKRGIYETDEPLDLEEAFSGSNKARTGALNDCLGASETDWGTYPSSGGTIEWQKDFLNQDNRYVPQGGETCNVSEYSVCAPMLADLERMRWDVLNIGYHQDVLQSWRDGGCFDEVQRSLGHRLSLIGAVLADSVRPAGVFTGTLEITNNGWGKIYNPRYVELVFRNASSNDEFAVPIHRFKDPAADPRYWLKGDTASFYFEARIPDVEEGSWHLFLNLPDTAAALRSSPEYSIRLANQGVWEENTGYNDLLHDVIVSQQAPLILHKLVQPGQSRTLRGLHRTEDGIRFILDIPSSGYYTLDIVDLSGQQIWNHGIQTAAEGVNDLEWQPGKYINGLYVLIIRGPGIQFPYRFTIFH
jgi:hypothetical protein